MRVTFEDCRNELLLNTNDFGHRSYQRWRERSDTKPQVVPFVENFVHEYLYSITYSQYQNVTRNSEHALGSVKKEESIRAVEDFTCPFAFQHLFHYYIESNRSLPTWQEFSEWLKGPARLMYVDLILQKFGEAYKGEERGLLAKAVRWRLGKFYYSAMREIELLIRLKEEFNLPLHYHLLADVLLRVDFWHKNVLVCIWFENPRYRSNQGGRKPAAEVFFNQVNNTFKFVNVGVECQGYGNFWKVSDSSITNLAHTIRATAIL